MILRANHERVAGFWVGNIRAVLTRLGTAKEQTVQSVGFFGYEPRSLHSTRCDFSSVRHPPWT